MQLAGKGRMNEPTMGKVRVPVPAAQERMAAGSTQEGVLRVGEKTKVGQARVRKVQRTRIQSMVKSLEKEKAGRENLAPEPSFEDTRKELCR